MAKYAPSALLGRLSRSAGSTTFAHNRFGAYLRNRTIPTNPATSAQTGVRTTLGDLSSAWRELTAAQRAAWTAYGENYVRTDSLGETYTLTGLQAFMSVNINRATYGNAQLSDAPIYAPPASLLTTAVTYDDTPVLSIAYTATPLAAGQKLLIFATRPLSQGINFQQRGAYKLVHVSAAAAASPANILAGYTTIYGSIGNIGDKILFRGVVLDEDGLTSPDLNFSAIQVAGP